MHWPLPADVWFAKSVGDERSDCISIYSRLLKFAPGHGRALFELLQGGRLCVIGIASASIREIDRER
jgi:hypothetical protein